MKTYKRGTIKASSYDALEKTAKNQIIPNIGMIQLQEITATDIQPLFSFRIPSRSITDYVAQLRTEKLIGTHGSKKKKKK